MKKLLLVTLLIGYFTIGNAQNINFIDSNFKNALLTHNPVIDTDENGEISIEEAEVVTYLKLSRQNISNLIEIEKFVNLQVLNADYNQLTSVDVSNNSNLTYLKLNSNNLTELDVSNNIDLTYLHVGVNTLTELNLLNNVNLTYLYLNSNSLTNINLSKNIKIGSLFLDNNNLTQINLPESPNLGLLHLNYNALTGIDLSNNINLTNLQLRFNNLKNLDISNNINLIKLELNVNALTDLDLSNNINLTDLKLGSNNFTELNISKNINLINLSLVNNLLTDFDLSKNINLTNLKLSGSIALTKVDLSNNINLTDLSINSSKITTLDVRSCSLTNLEFRGCSNLKTVFMTGQPLEYKTVSGEEILKVNLSYCSQLEFICVDQIYLSSINELLVKANQTDVTLSTDCGSLIQGTVTYDENKDGCDSQDLPFTGGLKLSAISLTGAPPIFVYPNEQGEYNLLLADDTYFIGPALQNPNYYTFSTPIIPSPINLPAQLNTVITDYCIQPLGNFNDLEISIVPVSRARPGFNATYVLVYKNIGNITQSGNITVDYQKDVLNYVSSTPTANSNTDGKLTWNFTNLLPLQTVEIPMTFILNTPTDSPALNNGDILNYTATATGATDETPDNNVMELAQTLVGSYDPNDKTCLEGNILKPDNVGSYLHYLIRFENKGTAEAVNIRVKDVIDTIKLDIESLIPLKSSHSYSTTITNGNEVEFTFNNINLPFDDANNDGYVVFKIKSKTTLVEGDKIVNSAAIYFDFNAPVITEDEIVTVKKEVIEEPKFSDYFTLSPNPTTGILNLTVLDESIQISYITIYDIGGNLVGYYLGTTRTMDVSYLYPNNYFMKIITNKGEQVTQFIKL
ncbi:hypothetical protein CXF68_04120 [Tenacibaculum sp. Bg11-29]|uniref:DUF7619 domain-containing protein n=1 Tax=Tenacibaculum sp. Bg11-29 TaxID=2058306 RepID=UPI000C32EAF7|nr:T9SS type A sorting domain-containing protein [Tenacibaculum sp. Bg11-29]PKH49938.1 hypothetical protein CXF68_04120 [Tenacibaculum sp. Bg11-29]